MCAIIYGKKTGLFLSIFCNKIIGRGRIAQGFSFFNGSAVRKGFGQSPEHLACQADFLAGVNGALETYAVF